jgi:hypothetical protein
MHDASNPEPDFFEQASAKKREMISLSESAVNDAMNELGFEVAFIDGKPNWVLYPLRRDLQD